MVLRKHKSWWGGTFPQRINSSFLGILTIMLGTVLIIDFFRMAPQQSVSLRDSSTKLHMRTLNEMGQEPANKSTIDRNRADKGHPPDFEDIKAPEHGYEDFPDAIKPENNTNESQRDFEFEHYYDTGHHELFKEREKQQRDVKSLFENVSFTAKYDSIKQQIEDTSKRDALRKKMKILCWVMTSPANIDKAHAVYSTWVKSCDFIFFASSKPHRTLPVVALNVKEGRDHLLQKTMKAFQYAYENYSDKADWFLKADDDTYIIVDNLRYLLSQYAATEPLYLGHHFQTLVQNGYMSGGAGYVLSREALRRLVTIGLTPTVDTDGRPNGQAHCREQTHKEASEDMWLGICLRHLGVKVAVSLDTDERETFHALPPGSHVSGKFQYWAYQRFVHPPMPGLACCSTLTISFHYVTPENMLVLHFLIHHVKVYGVETKFPNDLKAFEKKISFMGKPSFYRYDSKTPNKGLPKKGVEVQANVKSMRKHG